jgi:hypothetical protein
MRNQQHNKLKWIHEIGPVKNVKRLIKFNHNNLEPYPKLSHRWDDKRNTPICLNEIWETRIRKRLWNHMVCPETNDLSSFPNSKCHLESFRILGMHHFWTNHGKPKLLQHQSMLGLPKAAVQIAELVASGCRKPPQIRVQWSEWPIWVLVKIKMQTPPQKMLILIWKKIMNRI